MKDFFTNPLIMLLIFILLFLLISYFVKNNTLKKIQDDLNIVNNEN